MKPRKESHLVTATMQYLQCLENLGEILWHDRLNSGVFNVVNRYRDKGGHWREYSSRVKGCRAGTPDMYCILNTGTTLWIEAKGKHKQTDEQIKFMDNIDSTCTHEYIIIKTIDDLVAFFKHEGLTL